VGPHSNEITIKSCRLTLVIFSCLFALPATGQDPERTQSGEGLILRLVSPKRAYVLGEPVLLRLEIQNRTEENLFVGRNLIGADNETCTVHLTLRDHNGRESPHPMVIVDDGPGPRTEGFVTLLLRDWIVLPAGTYFGATEVLDKRSFSFLGKPGEYQIVGKYQCAGMLDPSQNNPLRDRTQDIAQLPFRTWEGEIRSNVLWIKIVALPGISPKRKSDSR